MPSTYSLDDVVRGSRVESIIRETFGENVAEEVIALTKTGADLEETETINTNRKSGNRN